MKKISKKIALVLALVMVACTMAIVMVACGANDSAESAWKNYVQASIDFNGDKASESFYFKSDAEKDLSVAALKATYALGKAAMEAADGSQRLDSFSYAKDGDFTEAELDEYKDEYGDKFETAEKGKITYKAAMSMAGEDLPSEPRTMSVVSLKINGKWYADLSSINLGF